VGASVPKTDPLSCLAWRGHLAAVCGLVAASNGGKMFPPRKNVSVTFVWRCCSRPIFASAAAPFAWWE
jgi:hypothetical protein